MSLESLEKLAINLLQTIFTSSDQIERKSSEQTILKLCEENESFLKVLANLITIESIASNNYIGFRYSMVFDDRRSKSCSCYCHKKKFIKMLHAIPFDDLEQNYPKLQFFNSIFK